MADANISVNKQTVLQLLTSGQETSFLIPEYQRPYSWGEDEIITLFDDLWEFSIERGKSKQNYFLGCIVSYKDNESNARQIIDGQQRLTSLFLLLRAIFFKLETGESKNTDMVDNFIQQIEPALWEKDEMTGKVNRKKMLLKSDVVSDSGNELLRKILETGTVADDSKDNYSKNYRKFLELYNEKSEKDAIAIFDFINTLLKYTILLPIEADNQETALTIFNTLNNRGLPLSDADIFKSYLYKGLDDEGKVDFIQEWKQLEADTAEAKESIQSLFYYHMFYLRAIDGDEKTTTPGVRKYYLEKGKKRLSVDVVNQLKDSLNLWKVVNGRKPVDGEEWSDNIEIRQVLDCLSSYTNEFWKYPTSIYYMQYRDREDFEVLFLKFLRKLCVMLLTRYLEQPTVSAVKGDIMKLNAEIIRSYCPEFNAGFGSKQTTDELSEEKEKHKKDSLLIKPNKKAERMLLKLVAYLEENQTDLLPDSWDIEHIFPQKWDSKYYQLDEALAKDLLEHIGNKIPLENKLNISASNNYFDKKKGKYKDSKIAIAVKFGESALDEWTLEDVRRNDAKICTNLMTLFDKWVNDYTTSTSAENLSEPSEEDKAKIQEFIKKGWVQSI